jgi:hypothetical protein
LLQYKKYHGTSRNDWRLDITKGKWVPSRSVLAFFKPSRYSARHRAESEASAVDLIAKDVPPEGGGTGAMATGKIDAVVSSGWPALLLDPSLEDFLQEVISSEQESVYRSK